MSTSDSPEGQQQATFTSRVISSEFDLFKKDGRSPSSMTLLVLDQLRKDLPWSVGLYERIKHDVSRVRSDPNESRDVKGMQGVEERGWIGVVAHGDSSVSSDVNGLVIPHSGNGSSNHDDHLQVEDSDQEASATFNLIRRALLERQSIEKSTATDISWLAAHLNVAAQGHIQIFLYASWEPTQLGYPDEPSDSKEGRSRYPETDLALLKVRLGLVQSLVRYINMSLVPLLSETANEDWLELERTGKLLHKPYSRTNFLLGSVAEPLWEYLRQLDQEMGIHVYLKYVFPPLTDPLIREKEQAVNGYESSLPHGFRFGTLDDSQLQTVLDRSVIPRTLGLLREMINVGLWDDTRPLPIGWGFISKDGALSSMHVESEYRGKSLAVYLGKELLRTQAEKAVRFDEQEGQRRDKLYGWADVAPDNVASRKVMVKMGGKAMWRTAYIRINLGKCS